MVGSFGSSQDLGSTKLAAARDFCDIAEIRLDLLPENMNPNQEPVWAHLVEMPLLFTARREDEGGALPLTAEQRMSLLSAILPHANLIDIEVASIGEMTPLVEQMKERNIPWIASFHDFDQLPAAETLEQALQQAADAGAAAFKLAAKMNAPSDLSRLAEFQLADHPLPKSTMGMGPLAPVSRLLCAQCGSVLNYGFMGNHPTAPGQWDAGTLKQAISKIAPYHS